ncbi:MAG: 50S ribosomal protein L15 [Candidatus Babeliaceae bacterium]|nr:50S ribosomal protein L15 [Candidatus Babeliaceae bacterium]
MVLALDARISLTKKRKRVGRGGSRGGTSGRGHKGQKCRSGGGVSLTFEGGQMPLSRRLPKRGFSNVRFQDEWVVINVGQLASLFEPGQEITRAVLVERGMVRGAEKKKVKILGAGSLDRALIVEADAFSKTALEAIQKNGGEARLIKEK